MLNLIRKSIFVSCILLLSFSLQAEDKSDNAGKHLVLNLVGTGSMYENMVPDIDGDGQDDLAMCFDVQVFDAHTNRALGKGTDCLAMVTPTATGVALVGTSYFHLPGGTLITRGKTSVQPVFHPTITPRGQVITHITGASNDENAIVGGTGRFAHAKGTARLSGMVSMANFSGNVGDPISFDCLFVIALD